MCMKRNYHLSLVCTLFVNLETTFKYEFITVNSHFQANNNLNVIKCHSSNNTLEVFDFLLSSESKRFRFCCVINKLISPLDMEVNTCHLFFMIKTDSCRAFKF